MKLLKIILTFILSVLICKASALGIILLSAYIKKDSFFERDEKKIISYFKIIYIVSDLISCAAGFFILKLMEIKNALTISSGMFIVKAAVTYIRYRKNGEKVISEKLQELGR